MRPLLASWPDAARGHILAACTVSALCAVYAVRQTAAACKTASHAVQLSSGWRCRLSFTWHTGFAHCWGNPVEQMSFATVSADGSSSDYAAGMWSGPSYGVLSRCEFPRQRAESCAWLLQLSARDLTSFICSCCTCRHAAPIHHARRLFGQLSLTLSVCTARAGGHEGAGQGHHGLRVPGPQQAQPVQEGRRGLRAAAAHAAWHGRRPTLVLAGLHTNA